MKKKLLLFLLTIFPVCVLAQIVTTNPVFITDNISVDAIFDATGTGLDSYTGTDVYAHTGVITSKSSSDSDWKYAPTWLDNSEKYKLSSLGNNKWKLSITPDIRTYYGVPSGEKILKLVFVFRNGTGSKEGKDNGKDIYTDVGETDFQVKFETPATDRLLDKNTTLSIKANASTSTTIKLLLDKTQLATVSNATAISHSYKFSTPGNYWLIAEAGTSSNTVRDSIYINVKKEQVSQALPANAKAGINYIDDNTATFVLYAPEKENVYLIGDFNDWKIKNDYMLNKASSYWWITLSGLEKGKEYAFQYLVDGSLKIAEPYADKVLDPWNDQYIPVSVYPNLKAYPTGKTEGIVSVVQTGQAAYAWKNKTYTIPDKEKLVIYELLIRDFTEQHSFASTMQKLDYLQALGINAIELLPINEFEGNSSWGYNPSFYFAVDKYYGTKDAFKAFVDECHNRGMAVIIDMVLNHSYGQSPFVQLYWDNTNSRPASNNPWYNVTSPNTEYSWGYDFNHESDLTKALVDSINSFWMSEYKVDGFRFDFTKGFTNKSGNGQAFDQSRIDILKRMTTEIYKRNPDAIVIMEHLADNSEEKILSDADIMLWGNMNYNYSEGIMAYTENSKTDLSWGLYSKRSWSKPNLVSYMESHDEERLMYKTLTYGKVGTGYSTKNKATALDRAGMSAAFYLTLPGPKMIWQFGELGYDYSINTCSDGTTINEDCRVAEKPIRWDYFEDQDRKGLYNIYSKLIELKTNNDVFESTDMDYSLAGGQKYIVWRGTDANAFIIGNFDVSAANISLTIPQKGRWYDGITGEAVDIASTSYSVSLNPGEYKLYMDGGTTASIGDEIYEDNTPLTIYHDRIEYLDGDTPQSMSIYNISGILQKNKTNSYSVDISDLLPGCYLVKVKTTNKIMVRKFIKK